MLQALNTGHDGSLSTVHANGVRSTCSPGSRRSCSWPGVGLPLRAVRSQIGAAVDAVVHVVAARRRRAPGRGHRRGSPTPKMCSTCARCSSGAAACCDRRASRRDRRGGPTRRPFDREWLRVLTLACRVVAGPLAVAALVGARRAATEARTERARRWAAGHRWRLPARVRPRGRACARSTPTSSSSPRPPSSCGSAPPRRLACSRSALSPGLAARRARVLVATAGPLRLWVARARGRARRGSRPRCRSRVEQIAAAPAGRRDRLARRERARRRRRPARRRPAPGASRAPISASASPTRSRRGRSSATCPTCAASPVRSPSPTSRRWPQRACARRAGDVVAGPAGRGRRSRARCRPRPGCRRSSWGRAARVPGVLRAGRPGIGRSARRDRRRARLPGARARRSRRWLRSGCAGSCVSEV